MLSEAVRDELDSEIETQLFKDGLAAVLTLAL